MKFSSRKCPLIPASSDMASDFVSDLRSPSLWADSHPGLGSRCLSAPQGTPDAQPGTWVSACGIPALLWLSTVIPTHFPNWTVVSLLLDNQVLRPGCPALCAQPLLPFTAPIREVIIITHLSVAPIMFCSLKARAAASLTWLSQSLGPGT